MGDIFGEATRRLEVACETDTLAILGRVGGAVVASSADTVGRFVAAYGDLPGGQVAAEALCDPQFKSISLTLGDTIARSSNSGVVLDIGCGHGPLLQKLATIPAFFDAEHWHYVGVDYTDHHKDVFELAWSLGLKYRFDVLDIESFHENGLPAPYEGYELLVVVRNVLHELDIDATARLFHVLSSTMSTRDLLLLQDLALFPMAERGNCCWDSGHLCPALEEQGWTTTCVVEPTRSGNQWFTVSARRTANAPVTREDAKASVLQARLRQYGAWMELEGLVSKLPDSRDTRVAALDLDLQLAALNRQLVRAGALGVNPLSSSEEKRVAGLLFEKHLSTFDSSSVLANRQVPERSAHFRDRARDQDRFEEYLDSSISVAVVTGGPLIGKSALVKEVLSRRSHARQPVFLDVASTTTVWNMLENYLLAVGCKFSYELLSEFKSIRLSGVRRSLGEFVTRVAPVSIVVLDHFERALDHNGEVLDHEIEEFLRILMSAPEAKLVLTTTRSPTTLVRAVGSGVFAPERIGRLPRGEHVPNILGDFITPAELGIPKYPAELIDAIDNHPFLAFSAAQVLRAHGKTALADERFFEELREQLREELLRRIVPDQAMPAVELASIMRSPAPREIFTHIVGESTVEVAEDAGVLYGVFDRDRRDLTTSLGPLRIRGGAPGDQEDNADRLRDLHSAIADEFLHLYREDDDPRWLRELNYHTIAAGRSLAGQLGGTFASELAAAGDYWFQYPHKDFGKALECLTAAVDAGYESEHVRMRTAACLVRVGKTDEGYALHRRLVEENPGSVGLKSSHVDSLLAQGSYPRALKTLAEYGFDTSSGSWQAAQFGRAYYGTGQYSKAVAAFEISIREDPDESAFASLERAYRAMGDRDGVERTLTKGLRRFPRSPYLGLAYCSHLIRSGAPESLIDAEGRLRLMLEKRPHSGPVLHQLCKLLCLQNRSRECRALMDAIGWDVDQPEKYRTPIVVLILLGERRWDEAVYELADIPQDDAHLVGLARKAYLKWASATQDPVERVIIARRGLGVVVSPRLYNNLQVLVSTYRLAVEAEDAETTREMLEFIRRLNPDVADEVSSAAAESRYWEEDDFDVRAK